jgi:hypothetical protein
MYVILSTIDTDKLLAPYVFNTKKDAEKYAKREFMTGIWQIFEVNSYSFGV